ncbi:LysR substrate-binding domain-containing protein, partial [Pseudomonas syringae group genomosp. 7]|uniref:LysR substrate-binding domain-containing protein n=1 Tax=Pseudomonas syringae group genomosp. 7 TaxID=251699 RepID=UPI0037703865
ALWLGPLLGRYRDALPAVDIRLRVVDGLDSLIRAEFDLALYFLREGSPTGLDSRLQLSETVKAYCSPGNLNGRLLD